MINSRKDRRILRSTWQNRTTTSRTICQETGKFSVRSVSTRTVRRCLQHAQYRLVQCEDVCSTLSIDSYSAKMFSARSISTRTVRRYLQQRGL
ncbi:hypothetical protein TNCV_4020281 [Trichonephila clavipes]|nr:hypothetical protein TNCV_4020281 [Trichonephila clavipes]